MINFQVDIHFDNQVLRLTSGNCTAKSVLENVFQNDRELRVKSRLHWTFAPSLEAVTSIKGKKISDFLLKSDPKLGGVLLYSMKVKIRNNDEDDVTWKQ